MIKSRTPEEIASIIAKYVTVNPETILWVGSGLSYGIYPDWKTAVDILCEKCEIEKIETKNEQNIDFKKLVSKAEDCKQANLSNYEKHVGEMFGKKVTITRQAYQQIMQLSINTFLTTNFDPLLATAGKTYFRDDCKVMYYPNINLVDLDNSIKNIFYIHGIARKDDKPNGQDLVFANSDYQKVYNEKDGLVNMFLKPLVMRLPFIIIGSEFREPYIQELFKLMSDLNRELSNDPHYIHEIPQSFIILPVQNIILNKNVIEGEVDEFYKNLENEFLTIGITILWYNASDERHEEIEKIFDFWLKMLRKLND